MRALASILMLIGLMPFSLVEAQHETGENAKTEKEIPAEPVSSVNLSPIIYETSGIICWNKRIWTHNDNDDIKIYSLDTLTGNIIQSYDLAGAVNTEWEEISQDDDFIYLGDFGNNAAGNRADLKIFRIEKNSVLNNFPVIDVINFSYSDQVSFDPVGPNNTDFDCEAFIVTHDSIFLFTKQWVSEKTSLYSLPKIPGTYMAKFRASYDVQGLITGAVCLENKRLVALCGYSTELEPFIFFFYDYKDYSFFNANRKKVGITLPFHQVEGVTSTDGLKYYITNEHFERPPFVDVTQKLHVLDLTPAIGSYINHVTGVTAVETQKYFSVYPLPSEDFITIKSVESQLPVSYSISDMAGQTILIGRLLEASTTINLSCLSSGIYLLTLSGTVRQSIKVVKN